jgi:Protein of unknown function (DUF3667)
METFGVITCKNCGNHFTGTYCNQCGEKVYTHHDKTFGHIFEEGFHFLTHFEGSFLTTLKTVFTKPGKFSLEYCNGLRKKYFKPVSFFLLLVVLYLLFPRFSGLNMKLGTYAAELYGFTWVSIPLIKSKLKAKNITYKELAVLYDAKSSSVSKIGLFFILPFASAVLLLLFFNTKKYYFDHFILALELCSIFIALHFLIIPFLSFLAELINKSWASFFWDDNYWLGYSIMALDLLIVSVAFRRFYKQKWIWTIPKAIIYILVFGEVIIYLYRVLVLVVTLALT